MEKYRNLFKIWHVINFFYNNDYELLDYETNDPLVAERCITSRLAMYLQEEFKYYNVDCEYNRHGLNKKIINGKDAYPDIIIHDRKIDNDNLVWIEVKKSTSTAKEIKSDRDRLKYVVDNKKEYKYK